MAESPFMSDGPAFERRAFEHGDELEGELAEDEMEGELGEDELEGEDEDDELGDEDEDDLDEDEVDDDEDDELEEEEEEDEDDDELDDAEEASARSSAASRLETPGEDDFAAPGNRAEGGAARTVLEHIARSIVDEPEAVVVEVAPARSGVKLSLHVAPGDMGRIIGRRGRVAQAMRTVVRAAAASEGGDAVVDIVD